MQYFSIEQMDYEAKNQKKFVDDWEAQYQEMIEQSAKLVIERGDAHPIVLLSGPSGSGKTTTAERLEAYMNEHGHPTHTLSMDNYYYRRADGVMPHDEEGEIDFESPLIIDMKLLREHLQLIAQGHPVSMPIFDFANQRRSEQVIPFHRKAGEMVIMEGIHALNPEVVGEVHSISTGIYVSVRTRVTDSAGYVLHPSRIRLMRRLIRDRRGRGQSFSDTVARLRSVSRGERLYILPVKHHADISLDTFCSYELPLYRDAVLQGLAEVDPVFLEDMHVSDMVPMLTQMPSVDLSLVPENSLVREFIGSGV